MSYRKTSAMLFAQTTLPDAWNLVAWASYVVTIIVLASLWALKSIAPARWACAAAGIFACGAVLLSGESDAAFALAALLNGTAMGILAIRSGVLLCRQFLEYGPLPVFATVLVCLLGIFGIQAAGATTQTVAMALLSLAAGVSLGLESKTQAQGTCENVHTDSKRAQTRRVILVLAAVCATYIVSGILNGLAAANFSLSSGTTTFMCVVSLATIVLAAIGVLWLKRIGIRPSEAWMPIATALLGIMLICITFLANYDQTACLGMVLALALLSFLGSWAFCPCVIGAAGLPIVPTFCIVSLVCYGYPWRKLGSLLAASHVGIPTAALAGAILAASLLVALIAAMTARMGKLARQIDEAGPAGVDATTAAQSNLSRYQLSAREMEVALLALHGYTATRIADELGVAETTVRFHLRNIYQKCGVSSKQELIDLASKRG